MKRKVIGLLISVLALSGIVGVSLAQAGGNSTDQNVQQVATDGAQQNEANESSEVEDADEPGDKDGPGEEANDD